MEKPPISFKGYRIAEICYKNKNESDDNLYENANEILSNIDQPFSLAIKIGVTEDYDRSIINLIASLDHEGILESRVEIEGMFELENKEYSKKELDKFLEENGVAILMPYVRSILSMISGLDSSNSIILPTVNFTDLVDKEVHPES